MVYLFALAAIALSDAAALQTISYHSTIAECMTEKNKIEKTINKTYIKLDCIQLKAVEEESK